MNTLRNDLMDLALTNRDLDRLTSSTLVLSVPTLEESVLLHSYDENDGVTKLLADTKSGEKVSFFRQDGELLQVRDMDPNVSRDSQLALATPIHRLDLIKTNNLWVADLEPEFIKNRQSLVGFITIAAHFAALKQEIQERAISRTS